jgi:predicted PurR-regulated permease PerM
VTGIAEVAIGLVLRARPDLLPAPRRRSALGRPAALRPANRREPIDTVATTSASILYGSMVGTAIVSFAGAVLQFITMVLLGLPLAFPVSVLMFFGGFIPYVGSFIVTLIGFLIAVAVGSTADLIFYAIYTIVFNIVPGQHSSRRSCTRRR